MANADLLVYEPFDFSLGPLLGQEGGIGFLEPWGPGEQGGEPTIYDQTSASVINNNAGGEIDWNGVVNNLPTVPAPPSARFVTSGPFNTADRITANRILSQSAGELAGDDNVLWASVVWHQLGANFGRHVGFALGTDGLSNRARNVDASENLGAGLGGAIGVGGAINTGLVTPVIFDNGNILARTTTGATSVSFSLDNIVVLKFDFADGATPDTVSAYTFTESVEPLESTFDANAISASAVIEQNTLNLLSFSQSRGQEAIDEIRLGDTFEDLISGVITTSPLTLQVNRATGNFVLFGDGEESLDINYYQITSSEDSLNPPGWNSLAAQDFEGNGPPDGWGNGWEQGGGVSESGLAEGYLLGDSTIAAGAEVSLVTAYDYSVDASDLLFRYRIDTEQTFDGEVLYINKLYGDYNNDQVVDLADYTLWRNNLGAPAGTLLNDIHEGMIGRSVQRLESEPRRNVGNE